MTSIITNPNEGPNGGIEGKVVENDDMKTASNVGSGRSLEPKTDILNCVLDCEKR